MNLSRAGTTGDRTVTVHRALADWGEAGSDAIGNEGRGVPALPGDVTWTHRFHEGEAWDNEGGDFVEAPSSWLDVGRIGAYMFGSMQGMIADVQAWLDDPASNFGWLLKGDETRAKTSKRFDSRDKIEEANRPVLVVHYARAG